MCATYMLLAAFGSPLTVALWNRGDTARDSRVAVNGPETWAVPERSTYSATLDASTCLYGWSKRPNPKRFSPGVRIETVGATIGPRPRPRRRSANVRPRADLNAAAPEVDVGVSPDF